VEAEREAERAAGKPSLVTMAELIAAHIAHRAGALGKGSVLDDLVPKGEALADAASRATETGDASELGQLAAALGSRLARVAGLAASADVSYPLQLLTEDLPELIAAVRPHQNVAGQVVASSTAPAAQRALGYQRVR